MLGILRICLSNYFPIHLIHRKFIGTFFSSFFRISSSYLTSDGNKRSCNGLSEQRENTSLFGTVDHLLMIFYRLLPWWFVEKERFLSGFLNAKDPGETKSRITRSEACRFRGAGQAKTLIKLDQHELETDR